VPAEPGPEFPARNVNQEPIETKRHLICEFRHKRDRNYDVTSLQTSYPLKFKNNISLKAGLSIDRSAVMGYNYFAKKINHMGVLMSYLICEKRKGSQKVHVEVCQKKCKFVQECKSFKEFMSNQEKKAA